jgi:hypothetical protein
VVFLDPHRLDDDILRGEVDLGYATYKKDGPDEKAVKMNNAYDPEWEIVF